MYEKENSRVITSRVNSLFAEIAVQARVLGDKKRTILVKIILLEVMLGWLLPVLTKLR